ncbi:MAG: penicillin-binding protein [Paenibacillaceae bacterium]|nr:penicillin-binding protein [Paenibacillaceae bacterium]
MSKRRLFGALLAMMALMAGLLLRTIWIQGIARDRFSSKQVNLVTQSVLQREQRLLLHSGRGNFYDRSGKPLTGETYPALLVFPVLLDSRPEPGELAKLYRILGTDSTAWNSFCKKLSTPRFWNDASALGLPVRLTEETAAAIGELKLEGLAVVPYERRYVAPYAAAQLIGYVSQDPARLRAEFMPMLQAGRLVPSSQIGASGLEKTFEPYLRGIGGTFISLYTDSLNHPIPGIGYRVHAPDNPYYPLRVITTVDGGLQADLEQLADQAGLKDGAIVVLDAENADIAAMVSRPAFNPDHVNPGAPGWNNRALQEAAPGSIFKTIVAAAALEHGVAAPDEVFECKGAWGKYHFTCWKKEGHGQITFRQAYEQSCNIVFGQIMLRLEPGQLEDTARKLGLGLPAGWTGKLLQTKDFKQLDGEQLGRIWADTAAAVDEGIRLQTAIGQRDVRMTPLQAANMVVALLNGGEARSARAVREIRYGTGRLMTAFPKHKLQDAQEGIGKRTSGILLEWMKDVVEDGTGTALKGARWQLAGKSGTAQVPEGGTDLYNQWFVGYGPVEAPRYAVAVASLRQKASGPEAVRLFGQVMDLLAKHQETGLADQ